MLASACDRDHCANAEFRKVAAFRRGCECHRKHNICKTPSARESIRCAPTPSLDSVAVKYLSDLPDTVGSQEQVTQQVFGNRLRFVL